ncbi:MAG: helix-turn-helix domain-containing protein [Treponema sp.]|nr:helix-turn-helix domain-containing protein [Treponema sp.]
MTNLRHLLGSNIKIYRSAGGLSQSKLAERADTATNYIAAIEAGRRFPSVEMLEKIASVLGIDTPELFSMRPIQFDEMKKEVEEHIWLSVEKSISAYILKNLKDLRKR